MPKHKIIWLLEEGAYFSERGLVILAASSRRKITSWVKKNRPEYKQVPDPIHGSEIYFTSDADGNWLRCRGSGYCAFIG
jgi:hypothetical protein